MHLLQEQHEPDLSLCARTVVSAEKGRNLKLTGARRFRYQSREVDEHIANCINQHVSLDKALGKYETST